MQPVFVCQGKMFRILIAGDIRLSSSARVRETKEQKNLFVLYDGIQRVDIRTVRQCNPNLPHKSGQNNSALQFPLSHKCHDFGASKP